LVEFLIKSVISLAPALLFLVVLLQIDSYKLVRFELVLKTIVAGGLLAMLAYAANGYAISVLKLEIGDYRRYVAPLIEELLKASAVLFLFRTNRIGFPIDSIILGFAVGTGFALFENMYYLQIGAGDNIGVWVIRGFGTAIMHGGTTAIFSALLQTLSSKRERARLLWSLPGFIAAAVLHGFFNQFPNNPLFSTIPTIIILPLTFLFVFKRSERAIHTWLVMDFVSHEHLIDQIKGGEYTHTEGGRLILELASRIDDADFTVIIEYVRVHTELVLAADSILLARERNLEIGVDDEIQRKFDLLHAHERTIGRSALMTIRPHLHFTRVELWELYQLESRAKHTSVHLTHWWEQAVAFRMSV
jgi:RsiW-degrading membrane proteinase PrsW (M82 family)